MHAVMVVDACRLEDIGAAASKEYGLEKAMDKMMTDWKDICFNFIAYRDTVCILLIIFNTELDITCILF